MEYQNKINKLYREVQMGEAIPSSMEDDKYVYINEKFELVYGKKPAEIALCVLSAINVGNIKELDELEDIMYNAVSALDFIIEYQEYPIDAAKKMIKRRSIGIGITNLAYFLAKRNLSYDSPETLEVIDELMEYIQFYAIKASVELAKEYGPCEWFGKTKYSEGILPIDTYNKNVDTIVKRKYSLDWEWLRKEVLEHGMRNSTLTALMPCESSSLANNSTNGMEPLRALITAKKSKQGVIKMVAPEINRLKNKYQLGFDLDGNSGIIKIQSVIQKWIDQGISANHYYEPKKYEDGNIPLSDVVKDLLDFYKYGGKQMYYANTNDNKSDDFSEVKTNSSNESKETNPADGSSDEDVVLNKGEVLLGDDDCVGGACSI